jgi:hypothetical protein
MDNPFADLIPKSTQENPFADLIPSSSVGGAAARGAAQAVVPAAGAIAGGEAGAALGGSVGGLPGAVVGGLAGGLAGAYLGGKGQEAVLGPPSAQTQADIQQHPYARFAGGFIPYAAAMQPGGGLRQAAVGAAIGGGLEAGQQATGSDKFDPAKIAIAGAGGALLNKPRFGGGAKEPDIKPDISGKENPFVDLIPKAKEENPFADLIPAQGASKGSKLPIPQETLKTPLETVPTKVEESPFAKHMGPVRDTYEMERAHREMSAGQEEVFSKPGKRGPAKNEPYVPVAQREGYVPTKERNRLRKEKVMKQELGGSVGAERIVKKPMTTFEPLKGSEDEIFGAYTARPQERTIQVRKEYEDLPEEVRSGNITPELFKEHVQPLIDERARLEELDTPAAMKKADLKEEEKQAFFASLAAQGDKDIYDVLPYGTGNRKPGEPEPEAKNAWVRERKKLNDLHNGLDQLAVFAQIKEERQNFMTTQTYGHPEYKRTRAPGFASQRMDPRLAAMFDNIAPKDDGDFLNYLHRANHLMINTLFYNPVVHGINELSNAIVANGWKNFDLMHYPALYKNYKKAAKETAESGPLYQEMLRNSASLRYSRIENKDLFGRMDREETLKDKGFLELAKHAGLNPIKLYKAWMETANKHLWKFSDVLRVQRTLELKDRGMSTGDAVAQMEKELVNYRVPTEAFVEGQPGIIASKILQDSTFNVFGRYHYGNAKVLGNMIRDLKGTPKERMEAAGKIVTLAALTGAIYPILMDPLVRLISGQSDTRARRPGVVQVANIPLDAVLGKGVDWNAISRSAGWEDSPVDKFILALLANLDWKGHHIVTPAASAERQVGEAVGFVGEAAIAPLAQTQKYLKSPEAFRAFIADAIIGESKEPKEGGNAAFYGKREAHGRYKHPDTIIEDWVNQIAGE